LSFLKKTIDAAGGQFQHLKWSNVSRKIVELKEYYKDKPEILSFIEDNPKEVQALYKNPVIKSIRSEFSVDYIQRYAKYKSKKILLKRVLFTNFKALDQHLVGYSDDIQYTYSGKLGSANKYFGKHAQFISYFLSSSPVHRWTDLGRYGNEIAALASRIGKQAAISFYFAQFQKCKDFHLSLRVNETIYGKYIERLIEYLIEKAPRSMRTHADLGYVYTYLFNKFCI
jgi:hypothetical protein